MKPKAFFIVMAYGILKFIDGLRVVHDEFDKKHLVFYPGLFYIKFSKEEAIEIRDMLNNTIENYDRVIQYVDFKNNEFEEGFTKNYKNPSPKKQVCKKGVVYIMKCSITNFYKIGMTKKSVNDRLKQLKTSNPGIELITHYQVENIEVEKELHLKFSKKNIRLEWFDLTEKDLKYIDKFLTK